MLMTDLVNIWPDIELGMRRFDVFPKFIDNAMTKRTNFGALVSVFMIITAASLCWSEGWRFFHPPVKEQLVAVSDLGEAVSELALSFNITVSLPCVLTHLDVFDVVATPDLNERKSVFKLRLDEYGDPLPPITYPVGCGSCYGANQNDTHCCSSCEDVLSAYQTKEWSIADAMSWDQCKSEIASLSGGEFCRIYGTLPMHSVDGMFHIGPGINVPGRFGHQHDYSVIADKLNLTHHIDYLTLGNYIGPSALDKTRVVQTDKGEMHYRYNLKAVASLLVDGPNVEKGFQYTVNFAEIPVTETGRFGPGIHFFYGFAPVAVMTIPDRPSMALFLARCVSIIGGTFMLGRLID
jgi:hypothetical protein